MDVDAKNIYIYTHRHLDIQDFGTVWVSVDSVVFIVVGINS